MQFLVAYLATAFVFLIIDYVWLAHVMKDYFNTKLGHLMADEVNFTIAALFYLVFAAGIVLFCVMPALEAKSWVKAVLLGGALGFLAYGTYDVTNAATLKDWPLTLSVIDVTWGTALTAVSATAGYFITKIFYNS